MPTNKDAAASVQQNEHVDDKENVEDDHQDGLYFTLHTPMLQIPLQEIEHLKERVHNMGESIDNLKEENDELWNLLDTLSKRSKCSSDSNVPNDAVDQELEEQEQRLLKTIIRLRSERNHYRQLWEQMNIKDSLSSPTHVSSSTTPRQFGKKINLIKRVKDYIKHNTPNTEKSNMSTLEMMNYAWTHPDNGQPVPEITDVMKDLNKEEYNTHLNVTPSRVEQGTLNSKEEEEEQEQDEYTNGTQVILE